MSTKLVGNSGEVIASKYLENKGYFIIENNYLKPFGEIDIIGYDSDVLVFFEVKTRATRTYGSPAESIDEFKQKKIIQTAKEYVINHSLSHYQCRFDVVEVYILKTGVEINHIKNAFWEI